MIHRLVSGCVTNKKTLKCSGARTAGKWVTKQPILATIAEDHLKRL